MTRISVMNQSEIQDDFGQKADFIGLFAANSSRINSFIFCMVPNESDAEDIMQETTMTMWQKFDAYKHGTDFVAWAVTIAKYKILEFRRKNKAKHLQLDETVLSLLEKDSQRLFDDTDQRTRALRQCLQKLHKKDRDFLKLKYSEGLTAKKISHRIGVSLAAVYRVNARLNAQLLGCVQRILSVG
ncbi:MAG TPA: sigma-70 family RNA polymerase sigma factor [Phycisphaerales bacterium]|nr:sigma-70 family RNA polymerase sigma factor [Phycisphaerales bacterium]